MGRMACRDCTSAADIADADAADVDCIVLSFCLHLAACLALPADDDRSSCRLGRFLPNRPRPGSDWSCALQIEP